MKQQAVERFFNWTVSHFMFPSNCRNNGSNGFQLISFRYSHDVHTFLILFTLWRSFFGRRLRSFTIFTLEFAHEASINEGKWVSCLEIRRKSIWRRISCAVPEVSEREIISRLLLMNKCCTNWKLISTAEEKKIIKVYFWKNSMTVQFLGTHRCAPLGKWFYFIRKSFAKKKQKSLWWKITRLT